MNDQNVFRPEAEAVLLIECGGESDDEVRESLRELERLLVDQRRLASSSHLAPQTTSTSPKPMVWSTSSSAPRHAVSASRTAA